MNVAYLPGAPRKVSYEGHCSLESGCIADEGSFPFCAGKQRENKHIDCDRILSLRQLREMLIKLREREQHALEA